MKRLLVFRSLTLDGTIVGLFYDNGDMVIKSEVGSKDHCRFWRWNAETGRVEFKNVDDKWMSMKQHVQDDYQAYLASITVGAPGSS